MGNHWYQPTAQAGLDQAPSLAWTAVGILLIAATLAAMGFALAVLVMSDGQDEVPASQPDSTATPTLITPTASPVPAVNLAAQSSQSVIAPTATHSPVPNSHSDESVDGHCHSFARPNCHSDESADSHGYAYSLPNCHSDESADSHGYAYTRPNWSLRRVSRQPRLRILQSQQSLWRRQPLATPTAYARPTCHADTRANLHAHACTDSHTHTNVHANAGANLHAHACTNSHTHTNLQADARANPHVHTNSHTQASIAISQWPSLSLPNRKRLLRSGMKP